jgi:hypothetical protein
VRDRKSDVVEHIRSYPPLYLDIFKNWGEKNCLPLLSDMFILKVPETMLSS